jgi:hypothetical protein
MGGVRGFVGVTDDSWYRLLAERPDLLGEVNFWRPGGGGFQALRPGEPFFFKTHAPHNRVVGGGFLGGAARLPASEARDLLGPANGAVTSRSGAHGPHPGRHSARWVCAVSWCRFRAAGLRTCSMLAIAACLAPARCR